MNKMRVRRGICPAAVLCLLTAFSAAIDIRAAGGAENSRPKGIERQPEIIQQLSQSPSTDFSTPARTIAVVTGSLARLVQKSVVDVWLKIKLDSSGAVADAQVAYCSNPDKGLEKMALDTVRHVKFAVPSEYKDRRWLWHSVEFLDHKIDAQHESSAESRHVPRELFTLTEEQCTQPAQSVLRPPVSGERFSTIASSEIWFGVKLKPDKEPEIRTVYCYPCDSLTVVEARNSLRELKLEAPTKPKPIKGWLYHRVLVLAEGDSAKTNIAEIPVPLDTLAKPYVVAIKPPIMLYGWMPDYPVISKMNGETGTIWVKALVGADGTVAQVSISKSCNHPDLDKSAMESAWHYRYQPAIRDGRPIPMWVTYKVEFKMNSR